LNSLDEDVFVATIVGGGLSLGLIARRTYAFHEDNHLSWVLSVLAMIGAMLVVVVGFVLIVLSCMGIGWLWSKAGGFLKAKVEECDRSDSSE
jgi:hypothetical protein